MDRLSLEEKIPPTPWGMLPPVLRLLCVCESGEISRSLKDAFAGDRACAVEVVEVANPLLAIERMREEAFDTVIVAHEGTETLDWIEAIRVGAPRSQPVLVIGNLADREFSALCFEVGADGFLTIDAMTTREIIWHLARSSERRQLLEENDRLRSAEQRRREHEHDDTMKLLAEQAAILSIQPPEEELPHWLENDIRELITASVVMGSGNLVEEFDRFLANVRETGISTVCLMRTFVRVMESMIEDLGTRSSCHVYNRANLLMFEAMLKTPTVHRDAV